MRPLLLALLALACVGVPTESRALSDELMDAYKKEFAFLEAEKNALAGRLRSLEGQTAARVGGIKARIEDMQNELVAMRQESDKLEDELRRLERDAEKADDKGIQLEEVLTRAAEALDKAGYELGDVPSDLKAQSEMVPKVIDMALDHLAKSSSVRREAGIFFEVDGTRVEGEVLWLGRVAAYGIKEGEGTAALAPAGNNYLREWPQPSGDTAEALAKGESPETLELFLFDKLEKPITFTPEKTPGEIVEDGGAIAYVIVGLGIFAMVLILLRVLVLVLAGGGTKRYLAKVKPHIEAGDFPEAYAQVEKARGSGGRVIKATVANLHRDRETLEDLISESVLEEIPRIERFKATITVVAAVAPLLGLLGTVTGMISTFDIITTHGTGDPKLLAGGISEALITTELGLIVAIPTLLLGTLLAGRASQIQIQMERAAIAVVNMAQTAAPTPARASGAEESGESQTEATPIGKPAIAV